MQIRITTDYTIRTVLYLYLKRGQTVTSEEIAESVQVPFNYLHKVTRKLKNAGYIEAIQGQFGGYRIREPADGLSLYDVMCLTEPEKINRCLEEDHYCSRDAYGQCAVSRFYEMAQSDWDSRLKRMTLKVLAADPDREELRRILGDSRGGVYPDGMNSIGERRGKEDERRKGRKKQDGAED